MARSSSKTLIGLSSVLLGAVLFAGCGSSDDSVFGDGHNDPNNPRSGPGFGDPNENGGPDGNGGDPKGGAGQVGNVDPNSACATASDGAVLQPISLVFMIDRSGSMSSNGNAAVRWNPVKDGLLTFFGDSKANNISASLSFFPIVTGKNDTVVCNVADYTAPSIGMTQLPNAAAFTPAFGQAPKGGTPTKPALEGALEFAKTVKAAGKNVAVVLATDGEPNNCSSTPDSVKTVAAAGVTAGIKTYVIGVGSETGNLDGFAQSGGTTSAIMIPTNNAAQVSADLLKAIGQIASSLLGCNYGLPPPPAGQSLDVNAVNVNYTPPGGASKTLPYSADCSNADGWRYDNTSAPKEIILCSNMCNTAKVQAGAKLDIIFGCATEVPEGGVDPNGNPK